MLTEPFGVSLHNFDEHKTDFYTSEKKEMKNFNNEKTGIKVQFHIHFSRGI